MVKRRWVVAIAVAGFLLAVGLVLFIAVRRTNVPPAESTGPGPPVPEITVAAKADGPLGWTQVTPAPGFEQVEEMWTMTDGRYALWTGSEIWTSADGMEWEVSATTPDLVDPSSDARSVIDFGGGWLDVGTDLDGGPVVAYSTDGATWEATPLPATRAQPLMIAASSSTAVVIGMALAPAADTVVWTSHDGRSWDGARTTAFAPASDGENVRPERLVFTGIEFVIQGVESWTVPGWFPRMWRSPDGAGWTEGDRYSHGMNWDGRGGVEALTAFDGEPLVLQNQETESGYSDTFEDTKFSGWPAGLAGSVSGEPVGGELGVIVATTTELWFTPDGHDWSSQRLFGVFGSGGDMIGAAVSNVTVLVAFSPRGGGPIELWLGEPTG